MKVCEKCGDELFTKDGDNDCPNCEKKAATKAKRNKARRERDQLMRDHGMVKVKGNLGGTYWE